VNSIVNNHHFACALDSVELMTSGPNFVNRQAVSYWNEGYRFVAAAGFSGVELPHKPYDFNLGRSGAPYNTKALETKYGSSRGFLEYLQSVGVARVDCLHISMQDVWLSMLDQGKDPAGYFEEAAAFADETVMLAKQLGCDTVAVTPTPEIGALAAAFGQDGWQPAQVEGALKLLNGLAARAAGSGVRIAVRNAFWSLVHGEHLHRFLSELDAAVLFSPDAAHLQISGDNPAEAAARYPGRLACPKLTDTRFTDEEGNFAKSGAEAPQHGKQRIQCDPGDGDVDLPAFYQSVKGTGYSGIFIIGSKNAFEISKALLKMSWYAQHALAAK